MNCPVREPLTLFAFRTHAHQYGRVITGYKVDEGEFHEVARGDPQKPQTFYPMPEPVKVEKDQVLAARSEGKKASTLSN